MEHLAILFSKIVIRHSLTVAEIFQVVHYTGREYPGTTQLAAARVLTSLYRLGGAREVEGVVTFRVLPCLVRYVEA